MNTLHWVLVLRAKYNVEKDLHISRSLNVYIRTYHGKFTKSNVQYVRPIVHTMHADSFLKYFHLLSFFFSAQPCIRALTAHMSSLDISLQQVYANNFL